MYKDKTITCKDCGTEFVFTANEQEFYAEKGFQNDPQRCKSCRDAKKAASGKGSTRTVKEMFDAVCSKCGKDTQVPFKPTGTKPILCRDCYMNKR